MPGREAPVAAHAVRAAAIARRHGFPAATPEVTWRGATSDVVACGDVVVKLAHPWPDAVESLRVDVHVNRVVAGLGVPVPAVLVHAVDDGGAYAVLERVRGQTLEERGRTSTDLQPVWVEVGRCLALVHDVRPGDVRAGALADLDGLRRFHQTPDTDPRPWLEDLARAGVVERALRDAVRRELDHGADAVVAGHLLSLCHGDLNAGNVVCGPDGVTLLDWAGAGWLDPLWDLAAVPPAAVPHLLAGHRARRPLPDDDTAFARLTWIRLQMVLRRALDAGAGDRRRERVEGELAAVLAARHGQWPAR